MTTRRPTGDRDSEGDLAGSDPQADESVSGWYVLIYEATSTHHGRKLTHKIPIGADHAKAVKYALRIAAEYRPGFPSMPRSRQAFQTSPDSWTVEVTGATTVYTFDIKIAWRVI